MKKNEIKFKVTYNPDIFEKLGEFMNLVDFDITKVERLEKYVVSWETTTKIDKNYIEKMKKALQESFEMNLGRVVSIEKI